jgi:hypothetical protein
MWRNSSRFGSRETNHMFLETRTSARTFHRGTAAALPHRACSGFCPPFETCQPALDFHLSL